MEKLNGCAVLQRQGGSSNEPNIYFYIGIGDKKNLNNLMDNYTVALSRVLEDMGQNASELARIAIKVKPTNVFNATMQRTNSTVVKNNSKFNYVKINYAKVNRNVNQFSNMQKSIWGNFIKKEMDKGYGSQVIWITARKVSRDENGYNWNCITID